ncbi:MAG: nucleoside diphosphate kinase regulator [Chelatococcus sp.]|uniref:nucleoside diphosphate kinase regulator n=1 Tax=unclassified Chelatococcus TaxID=2638111 RepID=UPI001BCB5A93|nr:MULTISPECIES: nucleoside diphosphate kinase regulator [unclassified Chelatococcus]CAH1652671.1 Regulator of nucleoside diphosphate kinase [Hyphomicrobiales bacterium]MBS7740017.1 nucleoside diphosphate kinase regulator [Chelatococcus sp. HY11]MBX3540264.1 nucleoside diphosphate kinase regulator [Chelatococcus sp.]MBX3545154.1 nucleoside diphosphate kinase regulator [Chelatococcus sp.]MCO5078683.1 nucleoside diphosphate kinase regulator [Chelatococcus sp.]
MSSTQAKKRRKPKIVVSEADYDRLVGLATAALDRIPEVAEELLAEMDRASVVADRSVPRNAVRMGSTLEYQTAEGEKRRVTLVYPGDANIADGKISIMTPIGTALIGLSPGQSINWIARDGRQHELTVVTVEQPSTAS